MAATTASLVFSTQITHIGSGASIAAAGLSGSGDISVALVGSGNLARYPLADAELTYSRSANQGSASNWITLYRRDINSAGGSVDDPIPQTTGSINYLHKYVGAFVAQSNSATASQTITLTCRDIPLTGDDCEFYIENSTGINMLAGWTLKITPKSFAGA